MSGPSFIVDIDRVVLDGVDPRRAGELRGFLEGEIARSLPQTGSSVAIARAAASEVLAFVSGVANGNQ